MAEVEVDEMFRFCSSALVSCSVAGSMLKDKETLKAVGEYTMSLKQSFTFLHVIRVGAEESVLVLP